MRKSMKWALYAVVALVILYLVTMGMKNEKFTLAPGPTSMQKCGNGKVYGTDSKKCYEEITGLESKDCKSPNTKQKVNGHDKCFGPGTDPKHS
uniref:Uncharacterized protein n=1 Tax=viral metagenome TaxID=1070528 RepID=A0A6C0J5D6_9ZZZZ